MSKDLTLTEALRKTITDLIENGGGTAVEDPEDCDWFVCQYRDGPEYVRAARQGKIVGSLAWLYFIIFTNKWTDPLRRLLHYPVPKGGMEEFRGLTITISNYGGEARMYLQNLLRAAGAEVTGSMRQNNTHLITARKAGDKCEAALEWNVPMVNHLWVEESYAKCELQALSDPRYTHFPPRTNLGEVIGQTWFDESRLFSRYYSESDDDEEMDVTACRQRRLRDLARENARSHGPAAGLVVGRQKHPEFDIMKDDGDTYAKKTNKKFGVPAPPNPKVQAATTPVQPRRAHPGKENDTPSLFSSGGRSAKVSALNKLHTLAPDIALYEKERKRKSTGNTPFGGKRAAHQTELEQEQEREREREKKAREKRQSSSLEPEQEEGEEEQRPVKKHKSGLPPVDLRIVLTGYRGWIDSAKKEDADRVSARNCDLIFFYSC